jgi:hypothetical protein
MMRLLKLVQKLVHLVITGSVAGLWNGCPYVAIVVGGIQLLFGAWSVSPFHLLLGASVLTAGIRCLHPVLAGQRRVLCWLAWLSLDLAWLYRY